jgi:Zn-dependent M28 family amino/carboxypeptidase
VLGNIATSGKVVDSVLIVGAHYDKVDRGKGVADNWSGVTLLPTLFESLSSHPRRHTFVFIGFTDEEKGLLGSRYYVGQLNDERKARIKAMINLDSLGLTSTLVRVDQSDRELAGWLNGVAHHFGFPLQGYNLRGAGDDAQPFATSKISTITIHSVTADNYTVLHSRHDNFTAIDLDDYYETYQLLAHYLANLDILLK